MNVDFNDKFNDSGEKPRFIHKKNLVNEHAYQIFEFKEEKSDYEPVGDYILVDTEEKSELTQRHLDNMLTLLNGKRDLQDLSKMTDKRLLFNIVPRTDEKSPMKVIFRTHDGDGVSTENAIFTLEKGILDEG